MYFNNALQLFKVIITLIFPTCETQQQYNAIVYQLLIHKLIEHRVH